MPLWIDNSPDFRIYISNCSRFVLMAGPPDIKTLGDHLALIIALLGFLNPFTAQNFRGAGRIEALARFAPISRLLGMPLVIQHAVSLPPLEYHS